MRRRLTGIAFLLAAVLLVVVVWFPMRTTEWAVRVAAFAGAFATLGFGVTKNPDFFGCPSDVQRRWARLIALAGLLAAVAASLLVGGDAGINEYQR